MSAFNNEIESLIDEYSSALFEIERALFTKRYQLSKKHAELFSIQSISMVYSIWEGFIQSSFQLYIDVLNRMEINFENASDHIIIYHTEKRFKQFNSYPNDINKKLKFFNDLRTFHAQEILNIPRVVDAESNVGFDVLNKLLTTFSLEKFNDYWDIYTHPNPNLSSIMKDFLKYRNCVAHGADIFEQEKISHQMYKKYEKLILKLMDAVYLKMKNGLQNQTYLKK